MQSTVHHMLVLSMRLLARAAAFAFECARCCSFNFFVFSRFPPPPLSILRLSAFIADFITVAFVVFDAFFPISSYDVPLSLSLFIHLFRYCSILSIAPTWPSVCVKSSSRLIHARFLLTHAVFSPLRPTTFSSKPHTSKSITLIIITEIATEIK